MSSIPCLNVNNKVYTILISRFVEVAVTENLFRTGAEALDLVSLNIQRGRDHGDTWCNLRRALELPVPATFAEAYSLGLFPSETLDLFATVYEYVTLSHFELSKF